MNKTVGPAVADLGDGVVSAGAAWAVCTACGVLSFAAGPHPTVNSATIRLAVA